MNGKEKRKGGKEEKERRKEINGKVKGKAGKNRSDMINGEVKEKAGKKNELV